MGKIIDIDPRGDILLRIGRENDENERVFRACSRSLARASPVFDRMLYGEFLESKYKNNDQCESDWTVILSNDKASSMEILLNIVHSNFSKVPRVIGVEDLYGLTVLTDYYDATHILSPWVEAWMSSVDEINKDANRLMPKMLWISWELGQKEAFTVTVQRMLVESESSWSTEDEESEDVQTPLDVIERIDAIRTQTLQALLDVFSGLIEDLLVIDERPRWCRHATWLGPHRCESMILGSLTFCLTRAGLWPFVEARELKYSILGLYQKLKNVVVHDIGLAEGKSSIDHRECNPRAYLLSQVERIMKEIPSPLTDFHIKHLEEQAGKLQGYKECS